MFRVESRVIDNGVERLLCLCVFDLLRGIGLYAASFQKLVDLSREILARDVFFTNHGGERNSFAKQLPESEARQMPPVSLNERTRHDDLEFHFKAGIT